MAAQDEEEEDAEMAGASPPPAASAPFGGLHLTHLLEFPPMSAFAPQEQPHYAKVSRRVAQQVESVQADGTTSMVTVHQTVKVTEQTTVVARDPGLPVPTSPSDHFPIAIRFQLG